MAPLRMCRNWFVNLDNMKTLISIISVYLFVSCQSQEIAFKAEKVESEKLTVIEVFNDFQYHSTVNDSLLEEGKATLNDEKLILTPKPESSLTSLIHNREFRIVGKELCGIKYEQLSTDSSRTTLVAPVEELDKENCFEIKKPFDK